MLNLNEFSTILLYILQILSVLGIIYMRMVTLTRIEREIDGIKGDIATLKGTIETILDSCDSTKFRKALSDLDLVESRVHKTELSIANLNESFMNLTAKWNSRSRTEKTSKKKEVEFDPRDLTIEDEDLPIVEFPQADLFENQEIETKPKRRRFGETY